MLEAVRSKTSVKNDLPKAKNGCHLEEIRSISSFLFFCIKKRLFSLEKRRYNAAFALYDSVYDANVPDVRQTLKNRRIRRKKTQLGCRAVSFWNAGSQTFFMLAAFLRHSKSSSAL
ncbi:hypothetical protein [Bacillus paralicheniformis]|uniref:hypothetical protein n=1 Tax=Bacillus paralicheniformis TaxID=1648923 RepID=UPI001D044025|nr:hypothetical protein [Bacillus paralicheniformis]